MLLLLLLLPVAVQPLGEPTFFGSKQLYGAIINTDPMIADVLGRDFHRVPQGVNGTAKQNAMSRLENSKSMIEALPFKVEPWFCVYAPSCPGKEGKGNDRGVTMSHYQIWVGTRHLHYLLLLLLLLILLLLLLLLLLLGFLFSLQQHFQQHHHHHHHHYHHYHYHTKLHSFSLHLAIMIRLTLFSVPGMNQIKNMQLWPSSKTML